MPTDKREFVRIDVGYLDNPKIADALDASPLAVVLHVASITYCRQHRTDGVFAVSRLMRKVGARKSDVQVLFDLDLWTDLGGGKAELHDYLKHQESAEQIATRSESATKAIRTRWERARSTTRNTERTTDRNTERSTDRNTERSTNRNTEERREEKNTSAGSTTHHPEPSDDDPPQLETAAPKHVLPASWTPTTAHKAYALENGIDLKHEVQTFRANRRSRRLTSFDWDADFDGWLANAVRINTDRAARSADQPRPGSSVWANDVTGKGANA